MTDLLLFSSSKVAGYTERFGYARETMTNFLSSVERILFIPYALKDYDTYAQTVAEVFTSYGKKIESIHTKEDPIQAIKEAQCLFIGGGNTFLLLSTLQENKLMPAIRDSVLSGTKYMGVSAGSNLAGPTIKTTNDMPIVYPQSFDALDLVPFQINPHFLDTDPTSSHMGETREDRIREFHEQNDTPVIGLREGALLHVTDERIILGGIRGAKLFLKGKAPQEITSNEMLQALM